jgi:hypothetical protein
VINCDGDIVNCTIAGNTASSGTGGITDCLGTITNCIIWANSGTVSNQVTTSSTPTYSCIQDWSGGGTGNISTDPEFADPCSADYHLLPNSPCLNAGDPVFTPAPGETDIDGEQRIMNGRVDIGADESLITNPFIDIWPTEFAFTADVNGLNPDDQTLTIHNSGGGAIDWEITYSDCDWLDVNPASGNSAGEPNDVTLAVDISGLDWGIYDCNITVSDPCAMNSPQHANVTLDLTGPIIELSGVYFYDDFPTTVLDPENWTDTLGTPTVDSVGIGEPSPPYSLHFNHSSVPWAYHEWVISRAIDLGVVSNARLVYWYELRESRPETTHLSISYWNGSNWIELRRHGGSDMTEYVESIIELPTEAMPSGFRLRFHGTGGWAFNWFVDDIIVTSNPIIKLSSSEFNFYAYKDGPNPDNQILTIRNSGLGALNWEIAETCDWLTVSPTSGRSTIEPNEVTLSVDVSGLGWGEYNCQLTVSDPCAANNPRYVNVTLEITRPIIALSSSEFMFYAYKDGPNPDDQILTISNTAAGGGTLNWEIAYSDCNWLTVDPCSGSSTGQPDDITLSVDISGLDWGIYDCNLTVSDPCAVNSPQSVNVTLDITRPIIELSSSNFAFYADESGPNPANKILTISNTAAGGGTLNWEITETCDWLDVNPASGSSTSEPDDVILSVDISGLDWGIYDCNITVSDPCAQNNPQYVDVTLDITGPIIELSVSEFTFLLM